MGTNLKGHNNTASFTLPREVGMIARFLASGAANTGATYAIYIITLQFLSYRLSYSVAFVAGIVIAYKINRNFVFKAPPKKNALLVYPLIYVAQYLSGLGIAVIWVDYMHLHPVLAPAASIAITIPLTYLLNRWVFYRTDIQGSEHNSA